MPDIHLLTNEISDLIAAGEVIERPSSVVKELVENSIDAGATQITVEILSGGLKKIKVSDNGCGMNKDNAEKCFLKHATSKIKNVEDLFSIKTLGFRGEAIPSIAAVSQIRLITKEKNSLLGYEIVNEAGEIKSKKEIGSADGTTFEVSNLFFNTPARLKFMKSEQAETGVINSLIEKLSLSHPDISFKFISNGNIKLFTPGNGKISDAIYAVYGRDFASRLLQVNYEEGNVKVTGFTGKPLLNKPNRNFQLFFVNGRLIRSRVLQQSLEQSYKNAMLVGRYPCCIIFLTVPFAEVDINVHPNKTEIKFADDSYISNHISRAIAMSLRNDVNIFQVEENRPKKHEEPTVQKVSVSKQFSEHKPEIKLEEIKAEKSKQTIVEKKVKVEMVQPTNAAETHHINNNKIVEVSETFGKWQISTEKEIAEPKQVIEPIKDNNIPTYQELSVASEIVPLISDKTESNNEVLNEEKNLTTEKNESQNFPQQEMLFAEQNSDSTDTEQITKDDIQTELIPFKDEIFRIIGEAFKTYIIVEKDEEMLLFDKHALHERMIFEHIKKDSGVSSQILLTPYVCNLGTSENEIIVSHKEDMIKLGFDISDFGTALMIREIPSIVNTDDIEYILSKAAENFKTNKIITEEIFDELLYIVACKAAIKSGYNTSEAELQALIQEYLNNKENLRYCPHGRPITISFTEKFIEKQFKRIV